MSEFYYRVKDSNNKFAQGYIDALSISDAASKLEHKGYIVLEIREEVKQVNYSYNFNYNESFSIKEKKEFFNSFYVLYKSGLSVYEIFNTMAGSSYNKKIRGLCFKINKSIEKGNSLGDSLAVYYNVLGMAYCKLIVAGDESGKLESVLSGIVNTLNKEDEIKNKIITSSAYPVIIFLMAIGVFLIFKFFVFKVFASVGEGINLAAIAVSAIIKIVIVYAIIFGLALWVWFDKPIQKKIMNFLCKFPLLENILKNYYFSSFFMVLALAYESGITAWESLNLSNSVINNIQINRKIKKAETMIQQGCQIATAFGTSNIFSNNTISQIASGEKAGELEKVFKTISIDYAKRLEVAVQTCLKLIEPCLIIIVGIFVGYIAVTAYKSYYSAIFSMM